MSIGNMLDGTAAGSPVHFFTSHDETSHSAFTSEKRHRQEPQIESDTGSGNAPRFEPRNRQVKQGRRLDPSLLERAESLMQDIEKATPETAAVTMESLRCVCYELWATAATASQWHQLLLAAIESMVRSLDQLSPGQASALRGAIKDLSNPSLNSTFLEVARSRLIDEGHNPLAILTTFEDADDGDPAQVH
jgi:hypothetical protein